MNFYAVTRPLAAVCLCMLVLFCLPALAWKAGEPLGDITPEELVESLYEASKTGDMETLRELMRDFRTEEDELFFTDEELYVAARFSVSKNQTEALVFFLDDVGIDPDFQPEKQIGGLTRPLLHEAGHSKNPEIVRALLERGADPELLYIQYNNASPLAYFIKIKSSMEGVGLLLEYGADPDGVNAAGTPILVQASYDGHVETVRLLLSYNADIESKDSRGRTAIMRASYASKPEVVRVLIEYKANAEARDYEGLNLIDWIFKLGMPPFSDEIRKLLMAYAPGLFETVDGQGNDFFLLACQDNFYNIVHAMLQESGNPLKMSQKTNFKGKRCIDMATSPKARLAILEEILRFQGQGWVLPGGTASSPES